MPTEAITTAAWIDAGLIKEQDTSLIVDHNKVVTENRRVMNKLEAGFQDKARKEEIDCILFELGIDNTKVML